MRLKNTLLIIFALTSALSAQVDITGYYEPQLLGVKIENQFYQLFSNKLRIDLEMNSSENITFKANFDYITYHGYTSWDIKKFLPDNILNEVPDFVVQGVPVNPYQWEFKDRQFLDNAFVKVRFSKFDLTAGKQQISLGTGYVWNPTDVFNRKDVMDPTYEQPGHNALRIDLPLSDKSQIMGLYAPTDKWDSPDLIVKVKSRAGHFDVSLLAIQKQWKFTDARILDFINNKFYQLPVRRRITGFDFAGEIFGLGVWGEFAENHLQIKNSVWLDYEQQLAFSSENNQFEPMAINKQYFEWVFGLDYTFRSQTYIMAEFYQNNSAETDYHNYRFNNWMQYMMAETKTITRNQCYMMIQHPVNDFMTASVSGLYSFSDNSYAVFPTLAYNIFENMDLTLIGNLYFGKKGTAYSENMGSGFLARARVYF